MIRTIKIVLPYFLLSLFIFIPFWKLPQTFFQQDEWWSFGIFLAKEQKGGVVTIVVDSLLRDAKIHANPIAAVFYYVEYKVFGMNFTGYALVAIFLQIINTILLFQLMMLLFRRKMISFSIALLFSLSSIAHQAVSWVSANSTQLSITFSLIFSILFLLYLKNEQKRRMLLILSIPCMFIVLLIKETALPFFLLPVFIYFYSKKKNLLAHRQTLHIVGIVTIFYLLYRVIAFFMASPIRSGLQVVLEQPPPVTYIYRLVTLPFKALPESLIPMDWLLLFSRGLIRFAYPHFVSSDGSVNPYIAETAGLDLVTYVLSVIIGLITYFLFVSFKKQKEFQSGIILSFIIIAGSTLLIIFIPGKAGYVSIIEPRHLYGATIGASILTVLMLYAFTSRIRSKVLSRLLFFLAIFGISVIHIHFIQRDLGLLMSRSIIRKSLLTTVSQDYPSLPKQVVFYAQSNTAYYGLADDVKILPVQSGFGEMLMLWYQNTEYFPGCLYENAFLHGITEEGYRNCGGRGVGFFRQYDTLLAAVRKYQLPTEVVIAYNWNSKKSQFTNITKEIRNKLKNDLQYESKK